MGKALLLVAILGVVGYGIYRYVEPEKIPEIVLIDANGQKLNLDDLFGGKEYLLLVFTLNGCPISKFATETISEQFDRISGSVAVVGLFFGNQSGADKFQQENSIPYPLFGLRDAPDPMAVNELIEKVGFSSGTRSAVYGGTILLVDRNRELIFKLEKEELRELSKRIDKLIGT
jgi:peroxiredoxin